MTLILTHPEQLPPRARRLADLIPGVYVTRDSADPDRPLLRFLEALSQPLEELEGTIDRLYDDHFVERASAEALPLLAVMAGAKLYREDAASNRAAIARYVHWLRRKGTIATLEDVIGATSRWSAEVDEAYRSLLVTQDLRNLTPHRGRTVVVWDPIALADPLSRRAPGGMGPREAAAEPDRLARRPGESVETTLRRLGRPDAGRLAIAPRTVDFGGWAQPHMALVRTSRVSDARIEARDVGTLRPGADAAAQGGLRTIPHTDRPDIGFAGLTLDPAGGIERSAWSAPLEEDYDAARLTAAHEPAPDEPPARFATRVLTPTALAAEGDAVESGGALTLTVDGVELIGPPAPGAGPAGLSSDPPGPVPFAPVIGDAVLRFADGNRPAPGDTWVLRLIALEVPETVDVTVAGAIPLGDIDTENPATLETHATRGAPAVPTEGPTARTARAGAVAALRVTREGLDRGYRRAADGGWSIPVIGAPGGMPMTPVVAMADAGPPRLVRLERRAPDRVGIAVLRPDGPPGWDFTDLDLGALAPDDRPDLDAPRDGPHLALVAVPDGSVLITGADETEAGLGVWRIADPMGAPAAIRLDAALPARPPMRLAPAACLHDGRLFLYGGEEEAEDGGQVLFDLWSLAPTGPDAGQWRPHLVRLPREGREDAPRIGATLLSTIDGLVLIGGASVPGTLCPVVLRTSLAGPRPRWQRLPDLPLEDRAPGVLWARETVDGIEALAWADRTWPRLYRLPIDEGRWQVGEPERGDAPNPPADGDALFLGDEFLVAGPTPLPPSEIVVSLGEQGRIAFLPAIDLTDADDMRLFELSAGGDVTRWYPPGDLARATLRLGAGREAPVQTRHAPAPRVGAVERLAWRPLKLRQRRLGPWDQPLALILDDAVAFDPRLGRVAMRRELAPGRVTVAHRFARPDAVGPGFGVPGAALPDHWQESSPEFLEPVDAPRELAIARIDPRLAGEQTPEGGLYHGDLRAAVEDGGRQVLIEGSPRLAPARLPLPEATVTAIGTQSAAHAPFVLADDGVSISLRERLTAGGDPDAGPQVWLSQMVLEGALEAHLSAGRLDLRFCRLAAPGSVGLRVVGGGLQSALTLRTLPDSTLFVHLYGCHVGTLSVPPWVQVVAAGCVFDAGDRQATALAAAGGRLRLRHCTVRGQVRAGLLEASSCVFGGTVHCDQPQGGWVRYSVVTPGGRPPPLYKCTEQAPSFAAGQAGEPLWLALDENNGDALRASGEAGRTPGAHAQRAGRLLEATARTLDFLPMGLDAAHVDRARAANLHMNRRSL